MLLGLAERKLLGVHGRGAMASKAWKFVLGLFILLFVQTSVPALAGQIRYVYDEAGRLVQAISADGSGTTYQYDAIGNILSAKHINPGGVAISEFSPNAGQPGAQVTVYGSGFDEVPANNGVTLNGTPAVVTSATKNLLAFVVPTNATTGKITVTNSNGTATSVSDFIVATASAPTITSFSPTMGPAGTAINIVGTNFGAQPVANKVTLGTFATTVNSASATQLAISAPAFATSGKVAVTTANGKAISVEDFYALPTGVSAADIGYTGRLVAGWNSQTVQISAAGKKGLVLFDGSARQRFWLTFSNYTFSSNANVVVLKPDGTTLMTTSVDSSTSKVDVPALPVSGTYTIYINPTSSATGKVDIQLNLVAPDVLGSIAIDGASVPVNLSVRQRAMLTFSGTAGQHLGLGYSNVATSPASQTITYTVFSPDGTQLFSDNWRDNNSNNLPVLPVTGQYTLKVEQLTFATASALVTLSADAPGVVVPDGVATTFNTNRVGQNGRLTFSGTTGQTFWLNLSSGTFPNSAGIVIMKPDGSTLYSTSVTTSLQADIPSLPATGTYSIFIDPSTSNTGKVDVQLNSIAPDLVSAVDVDGAALPISLGIRQHGVVTFSANAGQNLGLGYTNVATNPSRQSIYFTVLKPDGSQLFSDNWNDSNSNDLPTLPVSGTYAIQIKSSGYVTTNLSLLVSSEVTGTVVPDAGPVTVNIARIGQNARLSFNGTAGQKYWIKLRGGTFTGASSLVTVFQPNGSSIVNSSASTSGDLDTGALPVSGTYSIWIGPRGTSTGKIDVEVVTIPADLTAAISIDGSPVSVSLAVKQRAILSFTGTAGQHLGLGYTGVNTVPAANVYYYAYKPDGTQLFSDIWGNSNSNDLPALPVSGTYTIKVQTADLATVTTNVWLSADVPATLKQGDPATTVQISRVGQNARLTFNGTAGQAYTLNFTSGTFPSSVSISVLKPDGSTLTATSMSSSATLSLPALPVTGTYSVFIGPNGTTTGQVNVQLQ